MWSKHCSVYYKRGVRTVQSVQNANFARGFFPACLGETIVRKLSGQLTAQPELSLIQEQVLIAGSQLPPQQRVNLVTTLTSIPDRLNFVSENVYTTDENGNFNTQNFSTEEGSSYSGIHSSGPIWSVRPQAESRKRVWLQDIRTPLQYHLQLYSRQNHLLAETRFAKIFLQPDITRIGINNGIIKGALFLPPPEKSRGKAIITIYGGVLKGRAPEDRAAVLAGEGFVTLALAYFGSADLQAYDGDLNLEYFESAIGFMVSCPEVSFKKVGLFGQSRGCEISAAIAAFLGDKIGPTVVTNGTFGSLPANTIYKDQIIKSSSSLWFSEGDRFQISQEAFLEYISEANRLVPLEQASAPILSISGLEDTLQSDRFAKHMLQRCQQHGKKNFEMVAYPGLGHLIDLPNSPVCTESITPFSPKKALYFGGNVEDHALAQFQVWDRMLLFYNNQSAWE